MDKKNTMLLTVIAVATLLVAVVGATFAYFSIVQNAEGNTQTNFAGQTEELTKYGTAVLNKSSEKLYMSLTAADMSYQNKTNSYYATATPNSEGSNRETGKQYHVISKAVISGGTVEDAVYECVSTLKVTATAKKTGEEQTSIADKVKAEDGKVYIAQEQSPSASNTVNVPTGEYTLKDLLDASEAGKTQTITYTIHGNSEVSLTADVEIVNTGVSQNDIAGSTITVDLENTDFYCAPKAAE